MIFIASNVNIKKIFRYFLFVEAFKNPGAISAQTAVGVGKIVKKDKKKCRPIYVIGPCNLPFASAVERNTLRPPRKPAEPTSLFRGEFVRALLKIMSSILRIL
jgi:hypothetical protein